MQHRDRVNVVKEPEKARLVRMLGTVALFSGLNKNDLERIANAGREVTFEAGKTILKQGEPGVGFFLILEGKVEVRKKGRTVGTAETGAFFGEMTVIDDKPRSADVVAVEPTRCFAMTAWSFSPFLRSPTIAVKIIRELVRRVRQLEENESD